MKDTDLIFELGVCNNMVRLIKVKSKIILCPRASCSSCSMGQSFGKKTDGSCWKGVMQDLKILES